MTTLSVTDRIRERLYESGLFNVEPERVNVFDTSSDEEKCDNLKNCPIDHANRRHRIKNKVHGQDGHCK